MQQPKGILNEQIILYKNVVAKTRGGPMYIFFFKYQNLNKPVTLITFRTLITLLLQLQLRQ